MVWCMAKRVAETGVANGSHSAVPNVYHLEGGTVNQIILMTLGYCIWIVEQLCGVPI